MKSEERPVMWKCSQCDKEFKYESEKRRHEQSHVPQFECKVCSKKFSFLSALRRHEKQHERKGSVICSKCDGKFRDESLLKRHIKYAHKGTYSCKKCIATFNSEIALDIHMKTHKPESERRYLCSFDGCEKTFNYRHHLKHHELTHTDTKQHFCNECGKGFIQLHHLKIHKRVHEPNSWLMCTEFNCNKKFANDYALKRHMATHKDKTIIGSNKKTKPIRNKEMQLVCNTCGELVSEKVFSKHVANCSLTVNIFDNSAIKNSIIEISKTIDNNDQNFTEGLEKESFRKIDINIDISSNCKSVLGSCIVSGDTEINDNCLCAQITSKGDEIDDNYEMILPSNNNKLKDNLKCIDTERNDMSCAGCDCADLCGIRDSNQFATTYEMPVMEYRNDGIVKIKDTFDFDLITDKIEPSETKINKVNLKEFKCVPLNSCKDVLGNCIVSGNGTIGEGCLCAKMSADDQQMIAQEIEEITPCPPWLNK